MHCLVLGSKHISALPPHRYETVFAANGALHHLSDFSYQPKFVYGVFTPYLFAPLDEGNPYFGRDLLRQETLARMRAYPPKVAFIRPGATTHKQKVAESAEQFFSGVTRIVPLNRHVLSWKILSLAGVGLLQRTLAVSSGYFSGLPILSQRAYKLSTGVLGLVLALGRKASKTTQVDIAGIGASESPYSYLPSSVSLRHSHLEADIQFVRRIRSRRQFSKIQIFDPGLEFATSPQRKT